MQLIDVATTSADVGASSARLAKIARIAELLARAGEAGDARLVAVIVSWLSGDLPQRQIGVGWAALRSLPAPAQEPTLTVAAVDAAFTEIGAVAGKGSQARRAGLVDDLFTAATERRADVPAASPRRRTASGRAGRGDGRRRGEGSGHPRRDRAQGGDAGRRSARRRGGRPDRR